MIRSKSGLEQIRFVRMSLRRRYRDISKITEGRIENSNVAIACRPAGKQISIIARSLSGLRSPWPSICEGEQGGREDEREKKREAMMDR